MKLRPYQQESITLIYDWFKSHDTGHVVLCLPGGSGKSVVIAELVRDAIQKWPQTRVLMLVSRKELIEQNAEKMNLLWPDAPMGIYSASVGQKVLTEQITFAGIQSIYKQSAKLGHIDLVICDECDEISHKQVGMYRTFFAGLESINPNIRMVGCTATPWRMGHGLITQGKDALFSDIIDPTSIGQLVNEGYLAPLRSKYTTAMIDVSGVHKQGGDYKSNELEQQALKCVGTIVAETIIRASHCKSILVFASGVNHAEEIALEFISSGIHADCVSGKDSKEERERKIKSFKSGELQVLTNYGILGVGFDHADIDCVVLARPTMSPRIYIQQAVRGMRLKSHTDHCLVLDFAGAVSQHGPVTCVIPPAKKGTKVGDAPVKICPGSMDDGAVCMEILHLSVMKCHVCGYEYTKRAKPKAVLYDDDIMGASHKSSMSIGSWRWGEHTSAQSGKRMLKVRYYGRSFTAPVIVEYFPVTHTGFAGDKARGTVAQIANLARAEKFSLDSEDDLANAATMLNNAHHPMTIKYRRDGKFYQVTERTWHDINN